MPAAASAGRGSAHRSAGDTGRASRSRCRCREDFAGFAGARRPGGWGRGAATRPTAAAGVPRSRGRPAGGTRAGPSGRRRTMPPWRSPSTRVPRPRSTCPSTRWLRENGAPGRRPCPGVRAATRCAGARPRAVAACGSGRVRSTCGASRSDSRTRSRHRPNDCRSRPSARHTACRESSRHNRPMTCRNSHDAHVWPACETRGRRRGRARGSGSRRSGPIAVELMY